MRKMYLFSLIFLFLLCSTVYGSNINQQKHFKDKCKLFEAVIKNNIARIELLINEGCDLNIRDQDGFTPLILAIATKKNIKVVKLLLTANSIDVNIRDKNGRNPLIWAASKGVYDIAQLLIDKGADLNLRTKKEGYTALTTSIVFGHKELAKLLIVKGANLDLRDKNDRTALMWSILYDYVELEKLIINNDADVNLRDKNDRTDALKDNNPFVQSYAAEALAKINDKRAVDPLLNLLKSGCSPMVRGYVKWALKDLGVHNYDFKRR